MSVCHASVGFKLIKRASDKTDVTVSVCYESSDPKNTAFAVGTARLAVIQAEIYILPVWRPPCCVSGVGQGRMLTDMSPLGRPSPKTWVLPLERRVYLL